MIKDTKGSTSRAMYSLGPEEACAKYIDPFVSLIIRADVVWFCQTLNFGRFYGTFSIHFRYIFVIFRPNQPGLRQELYWDKNKPATFSVHFRYIFVIFRPNQPGLGSDKSYIGTNKPDNTIHPDDCCSRGTHNTQRHMTLYQTFILDDLLWCFR